MEAGRIDLERARRLVEEATDGRRDHAEALLALDPDLGRHGLDVGARPRRGRARASGARA